MVATLWFGPALVDRLTGPGAVSWAAHQFEVYIVHAHLPRKMRGHVSFWAVAAGDFLPDFLSKFWVYGITVGATHYGASVPHQWHRGWPGMGITHTVLLRARWWRPRSGCGSATGP